MTSRCVTALCCAAVLLVTALSTGDALFWLLFLTLAVVIPTAYLAVRWVIRTLAVRCKMEKTSVSRGERVRLSLIHI